MTQLYALTAQFKELEAIAEGADEDLSVALRDTMQAIAGEFEDKGRAIATLVLNIGADVDALDAEIARLQERKRAVVNRQESLKDYLRENMDAAGIKKITHPLFSITCAPGRQVVVIDSESDIPDEYVSVKTEVKPDKVSILAALKEGVEIPGAHIELSKSSIRIK